MTDTPMTQDKHDTLIERLNLDHEVLLGDLWDEASGNDVLREAYKTIARNTQEAISRLKQSQWVRIDDPIVETWKDGREVDLISVNGTRYCGYRYYSDGGSMGNYWRKDGIMSGEYHCLRLGDVTHAMLPPQPPKG